jgi:ABC-2 type transport system permease protein
MNRSLVGRLIAKDLFLYRWLIAGALLAGVASLVVSSLSAGDNVTTGLNVGFLLFVTTVLTFGIFLAMTLVLKERQDKSRLFVLSLPVSPAEYSLAKILAVLCAYLGPWLVLTAGVVGLTFVSDRPDGGIPFFVAMMTFFLCTFCLLLALVVITLSEVWAVAGILGTNLAVTLFLVRVGNLPGVAGHSQDAAATWSSAILAVLGVEVALILLSLGLAFYLPSRKKDFV